MKSGEYNPIHHHPYCNVTHILFTDVNKKFIDEIITPNNNLIENGEVRIDESEMDDGIVGIIY